MKYFTKEELEEITGKLLENPTRETLKELNDKYNGVEVLNNSKVVEIPTETPQNYEMPPVVEEPIINTIPNAVVEEQAVNPIPPVMDNQVVTPIPNYEPIAEPSSPVAESPVEQQVEISSQVEVVSPAESEVVNQVPEKNIPVDNSNMGPQIPSFEIPQGNTLSSDNNINNEQIVETPTSVIESPVAQQAEIPSPIEVVSPAEPEVVNQVPEQNIPDNNSNMGPQIPSFEIPQVNTPTPDNSINNEPITFTGNLWEPQNQNDLMATTDSFNEGPIQEQNTQIPVGNEPFFGSATNQVNNPIPINNSMPQMPQGPSMFGQFEQNYNI